MTLIGLFGYGHGMAQQSQAVDVRFPVRFAQLLVPPTGYYDTPEAAFAAYRAGITNPELEVDNLRPCAANEIENQRSYDWGQPQSWCHDWRIVRNGVVTNSGVANYVSMTERCPDSHVQANWSALRGRGIGIDPWIFERRCERQKVQHHPQSCGMGNPIYPAEGAKRQVEIDYVDPLGRLDFSRTYDSDRGTFSHSMAATFIPPAKGAISGCDAMYVTIESGDRRRACAVRLGYQEASASFFDKNNVGYRFDWNGSTGNAVEKYNNDRLAATDLNGNSAWLVSRPDEGRALLFDVQGKLVRIFFNGGGRVQLNYSTAAIQNQTPGPDFLIAAEDDLGRSLRFFYSAAGLLAKVVTPDGASIDYASEYVGGMQWRDHASVGKVKSVTYPGGAQKTYVWDESDTMAGVILPNRLTGIIDEELNRYATFKYKDGRALSTEHKGGVDKFVIGDARVNGVGTVTVTEPSGAERQLTYGLVDGMSRLKSRQQPAGSGCESSSSSLDYDGRGNVASRVDFNGMRSCHAYASNRNLEIFRIEGLTEDETCPLDLADAKAAPDKPQRKVSIKWHRLWKLEAQRAEPKRITTTVYNGETDPIKNDGKEVVCAPDAPALPDGSKIAVVCTRYEQSTEDEMGNLGFSASVKETRKWTYAYNQYGHVIRETGPRGQADGKATSYEYWPETVFDGTESHWRGDLKRVTNTLGQVTHYLEYNKRGQVLKIQHPNGSIEQREYWPRGWLKSVKLIPNGAGAPEVTEYSYYPTGLLKKATQPDGSWTFYTWDEAHRLKNVKDSADNSVEYVLDNMGNREEEVYKDPQGTLVKTITRTFDALGRMDSSKGLH